jgi:Leucine-rich repeat (LRR) protein
LTSLRELNLSFNQIADITPVSSLCLLQKLFLNRNKIVVIDSIKSLINLEVLGLFHNEIIDFDSTLRIIQDLAQEGKLKELSIDGNPVSSSVNFKYTLILTATKLLTIDEDPVQ